MNDDLQIPNEERRSRNRQSPTRSKDLIPFIILLVILAGTATYFILWNKPEQVEKSVSVEIPVETREVELPEIRYPVPEIESRPVEQGEVKEKVVELKPLPPLDESDDAVRKEMGRLSDPEQLDNLILFKALIRHFVVTVDNLTNNKLPQRFSFARPPTGKFKVTEDAYEDTYLDPDNYRRYDAFVSFLESLDSTELVAVYIHYYPLFQEAYESLGYPGRYFNDRLVEVIDHLLGAPVIRTPIKLERPKVYFKFADPELEKLTAGRKAMVRIGPDNATRVKTKLGEIKQLLTSINL